jgi:hypothetical protein
VLYSHRARNNIQKCPLVPELDDIKGQHNDGQHNGGDRWHNDGNGQQGNRWHDDGNERHNDAAKRWQWAAQDGMVPLA